MLLHPRPPVVLDLVVGPPGQVLRDLGPPATDHSSSFIVCKASRVKEGRDYIWRDWFLPVSPARVELQDEELLLRGDVAPPDVGTKIVEPSKPAALPCSPQP
ncbi:hypothetical protein B296_00026496 [Ensete ventricosum]|uniref:Uncharacterized protein n=1 Tax=Ensete ventricosum TaxID=4639 RepID=A0A427AKI0_ENSVE|nr:hypothetical protein B296_00026496 [Ensete ventricosum]